MPKKVFELAKELDLKALDLVEKLKSEGFAVKNHMNVLSDEDVEKAMSLLAPAKEEKPKKKVVKKKKATVRKKKVVKKAAAAEKPTAPSETTSEKTTTQDSEQETQEAAQATKKKTIRKKAVIKKKGDGESSSSSSFMQAIQEATGEEVSSSETKLDEEKGLGLRVVSRPQETQDGEDTAPSAQSLSTPDKDSKSSESEPEVFKEKVHRFTPVYTPPARERQEGTAAGGDSTDDKKKSTTSKKRMGGLASMVSGKKVSRSQILNQTRADSELKSYSALSGGRPVYSQVKRKKVFVGETKQTEVTEVKESKRIVKVHKGALAKDLADKLSVKFDDFADKAMELNLLLSPNDYIGLKLCTDLCTLYSYRCEDSSFDEQAVLSGEKEKTKSSNSDEPIRSPIVTIMGHVDHGKTTLIDHIRDAKVAAGEAGGITQHIGAYMVDTKKGTKLTFLDTPGHAAFASMRQRGANLTDVVVLVVAADDGVMPQTRESVKYCENAGVPIIVAVNKMDKEQANPDRIKAELAELNLTPEDWGGETQYVHISALKGDGIDDLLESIALQAEILEPRASDKGRAEGIVIESKIEQGRGPVATILVQKGTLKKGDSVIVGETYGRARSLTDHLGKDLKSAGPSTPVQILGLGEAPNPGDSLNVTKNEREAKKIAHNRIDERKKLESVPEKKAVSLEDFFAQSAGTGETKNLNLIIRTDVQGSFEAIRQALEALSNDEVAVKVLSGGVGAISDSDVKLAESSEAILIGFNMRPVTTARRLAEQKGIEVKTYSVIYELIGDVKLALEGLLEPDFIETFIGRAEVKETFSVPKVGVIAGSLVIDGKISVGCHIRLLREGKIITDNGKLSSLKRFKDDAKEVKSGLECGIGLENFNDIKIGDVFEAYIMEEKKRSLEDVESASAQV